MALAVVLPKMVAIQNRPLAVLHYSIVFSLLFTLLFTKVHVSHEHLGMVPVETNLEMKWNENASVAGMENVLVKRPSLRAQCDSASTFSDTVIRWGHSWSRKGSCAQLCKLDEYLSHATWSENMSSVEQKRTACWSSFKDYGRGMRYTVAQFMESHGGKRDVSIITSKNDWQVDHRAQSRTNYVETVPQSIAAVLDLEYRYKLEGSPSWFPGSSQHQVSPDGSQRDARTLILDAQGRPVGDPIPPGDTIMFTLNDVWLYAGRTDGEEPGPPNRDVLINGAEILAMAACFGDDRHLLEYISGVQKDGGDPVTKDYGASLEDLVCVIRFEVVSARYQIHASFVAPQGAAGDYSQEVMSETTGITIKAISLRSTAEMWDWNTLILQFTSIVVLLSIPRVFTAFISKRLLGPLSSMYKRMLIEPYCIEEVAAMTSTVLAQNVSSFYQLSTQDEDGGETIHLNALRMLTQKAFANRPGETSGEELLSLSSFLYKGITKSNRRSADTIRGSWPILGALSHWFLDVAVGTEEEEESNTNNGITLDQWNHARLECEKITFGALQKLFEKDRRRSLVEKMFTPSEIKQALNRAMTHEQTATPHCCSPHPSLRPSGTGSTSIHSFSMHAVNSRPSAVHLHLPAEVSELLARVQVLEGEKEERDRESGTESAPAHRWTEPAHPWTEAALAPEQLEAEFPPGMQQAALPLESRELKEAFTYTLPLLAERLTSIESSMSSLAGDLARLKGAASKCEACDGFWASAILTSLPPDVMQELADVRGGMDELVQGNLTGERTSARTPGHAQEGHGQASSAPASQGELTSVRTPRHAQEGHGQASSAPAGQYAAAK